MLSKDQTAIVQHGADKNTQQWDPIAMPEGKQELPEWLTGLHIDWMMGYGNSPYVRFRVTHSPMPEDLPWEQGPDGRWFREYGDIMEQLWNRGELSQMPNGEWETTKTDGHGGRTSTLKMSDGRTVHLRGSWFGGTPEGWSEMSIVDMSSPYVQADQRQGKHKWEFHGHVTHKNLKARAWHKCGGNYGLYIHNNLLIKAIARYQPHVGIARVAPLSLKHRGDRIEPYLLEWGMPKRLWLESQRNK
jgi:hypothetical protein